MPLSLIYLIANVLCLAVLISRKYYQLWPACVAMQAVTSWQIGVSLFVPAHASITFWAVGECALLAATAIAVGEAVWKSLRQMSVINKVMTIGGLALFSGSVAMLVYADEPSRIWPASFFLVREQFFLSIAIGSFAALWIGLMHYREWPKVARMQLGIYAVMMCGHVLIVDWSHWQSSRTAWRILESLCCIGFLINSKFLVLELAAIQRFLGAVPRWPYSFPKPNLPALRSGARTDAPSRPSSPIRYRLS